MDKHFLTAPVEANLPMLLGLLSVYNSSVLDLNCVAVLPYCQVCNTFKRAYLRLCDLCERALGCGLVMSRLRSRFDLPWGS